MNKIIVSVVGGVISDISGIPAGVVVEVHDYDIEPEDVDESCQYGKDADGNGFFIGVWG